ncbi:MAG: amino acid--tRNA ligase-related protein, partial [Pirellulaceae bacterium]
MSPLALASAPIDHLVRRSHLLREARNWFHGRGFHEVQTPVLSRDCIIDQHLDPIACTPPHPALDSAPSWFLQTSPEQHMKRLLASGMQRIYQIGPVFRRGETGTLHNPEFTMLEWYSSPSGHQQGIDELTQLVGHLLFDLRRPPHSALDFEGREEQLDPRILRNHARLVGQLLPSQTIGEVPSHCLSQILIDPVVTQLAADLTHSWIVRELFQANQFVFDTGCWVLL